MERKLVVLLFVVVFGLPGYLSAQSASGIVAPSRMIDWSSAGVQGGIPNRTTICATLSPGASVSQINSAIASCPSGGVVKLNSGTYNLSGGISLGTSNVTLRGSGSDSTLLVFSGGTGSCGRSSNVCIGTSVSQSSPPHLTSWTAGYSSGTTTITLSSASGLSAGGIIILDQTNDSSDTGNVYVCSNCATNGTNGGGISRSNRNQVMVAKVTGVSGNNVTISPSLFMPNWRSAQSPQAYWPSSPVSMSGVEQLSIDGSSSSASTNIGIGGCINCWVKGVRSLYGNRDHVWTWYSTHVTVRDSYFYGLHSYTPSHYGIETDNVSSSVFENNIMEHIVAPLLIGNDSGDVYGYNYNIDDYYSSSSNWFKAGIFPHQAGTEMDLFEGNQMTGLQSDIVWGSHIFLTFFRNRLLGYDPADTGRTNNTIPVNVEAFGRYDNFVGNVLGYSGIHTQYQDLAPSGSNARHSIYVLGWYGENGGGTSNWDSMTISTMMRWGNYDIATNSVHWDPSEVPSGLSQYGNPVPSGQSLPSSFYLSSKPSWWGTPWGNPSWPAIGPDVTGGNGPGGHSYDIPAKLCYDNTSKDSNGILNFNADRCYSSAPAPTAPTGLGAVAH